MPVKKIEKSTGGLERWFRRFAERAHCAWLDSSGDSPDAEWSILAADPVETRRGPAEDLVAWMDEWEERLRPLQSDCSLPFVGGLIGQLDYAADPFGYPPESRPCLSGWMGLYDRALLEHRPTGTLFAVVGDWLDDADELLRCWMASLSSEGEPLKKPEPVRSTRPVPNQSRAEYVRGVARVREWIAAGDIYQANLSQRFSCVVTSDPVDLYLSLRSENPAPYSAFVDCGDRCILSSSPELFLAVERDRRIRTRPIKGTRPRSDDLEEDAVLAATLRSNVKERSELLMIVDMERNDLGRVCKIGSIQADREFALESFASVHHLIGEVSGTLQDSMKLSDVLAATFPGGSITGAPKCRSMEIIQLLEPGGRGAYCGTIGFVTAGGVSKWNIAIRTLELSGEVLEFGVGAGIVWDSDPGAEYEETLHKARKLFTTLGWEIEEEDL